MFTTLPTPLDCMATAANSPPSHVPQARAIPSSSVVSVMSRIAGSASHSSRNLPRPASGTVAT